VTSLKTGVLERSCDAAPVTDSKVQKQDPGDTQVFCIVASEERSRKEEGLSTTMSSAR